MEHVIIIEHPKPKSKLKHMKGLALAPSQFVRVTLSYTDSMTRP